VPDDTAGGRFANWHARSARSAPRPSPPAPTRPHVRVPAAARRAPVMPPNPASPRPPPAHGRSGCAA